MGVASPVVSLQLHGPTLAVSWAPLNVKHQAIQAYHVKNHLALNLDNISVEEVWQKLEEMHATIKERLEQRVIHGPYLVFGAKAPKTSPEGLNSEGSPCSI